MVKPPFVDLDVVIPFYNEAEALPLLFARLRQVFSPGALLENGLDDVRFIFVDDGSSDSSSEQICKLIAQGFPATLIRLSRNFGHQNAVSAGLAKSTARVTAVIDADLQDPPEVILQMLARWREGADVVFGVRRKRKEGPLKRLCYWAFYRCLSALSEVEVPMDSGDFCLMDRQVVQALASLPEKLRFARGLRAWVGFSQEGLEYERHGRSAGTSKYPFKDLYRLATDGIVSLSSRPLKVIQLCAAVFGAFFLGFLVFTAFYLSRTPLTGGHEVWFLASYTLSALSGFFVLLSLFIVCSYIGRMFFEVKGRPSFIVMEEITLESASTPKLARRISPFSAPSEGAV